MPAASDLQKANARLRAAAPELLKALEGLFQLHNEATGKIKQRHNPKEDIEEYYERIENQVRSAINQAKGK